MWLRRSSGPLHPIALAMACCLTLPAQDSPTFRVGTRLVQVDVIVRDANGPATGLTKDDFVLLDKGKPQQIAVFSVRTTPAQPPPATDQVAGVVSNRPQGRGTDPVSATVILFD